MDYYNQETQQFEQLSDRQSNLIVKKIRKEKRFFTNLQQQQVVVQKTPVENNVISKAKVSMKSQEGYQLESIFLLKFAKMCKISKYLPDQSFNAVQMWEDDWQADVYQNGMIKLITKRLVDINVCLEKICKLIRRCQQVSVIVQSILICNIVAGGYLPFRVNVDRIDKKDKQCDGITYIVRKSGSVMFFGGKDIQSIHNVYNKLCIQLKGYAI